MQQLKYIQINNSYKLNMLVSAAQPIFLSMFCGFRTIFSKKD